MKYISIILFVSLLCACDQQPKIFDNNKREGQNAKPENPREREEWRWNRKGRDASPEKILKARKIWTKKFDIEQKNFLTKDAGLNDWEEMGPFGVGGRVRSIAVDPNNNNHLFAGSVGGGLWETFNGGTNWNEVDDFLPSLSITQVLYDPNNNNILYATTGEGVNFGGSVSGSGFGIPGNGIYKSFDNGATWSVLQGSLIPFLTWINDIAIDPNDSDFIYVVTSAGGSANGSQVNGGSIYRSTDAGNSWSPIFNATGRLIDIKIDPNDSNIILIGASNGFIRITNALTNPNFDFPAPINTGGRVETCFAQSSPGVVYASVFNNGGEVWRSTNSGFTWTNMNASITPSNDCSGNATSLHGTLGWYANTIFVDPTNASRLVVGSVDLYRSLDSGNNFDRITDWCNDINGNSNGNDNSIHADQHAIVPFNNYNGGANSGVYIANDGGVYSTGAIWVADNEPPFNFLWNSNVGNMANTQFYGGSISDDGNTIIGGAQDNSFSISTNEGATWEQPTTGDGAYAAINYDDDQVIYANLNYNSIMKSEDGGNTFSFMAQFGDGPNPSNPACSNNANGCVVSNTFFVNDNAQLISLFIMDPNDPDIILVAARRLWRNNDAADPNDWNPIKNSVGTNLVSAIAADDGNSARIWVGYNNGRLERTTNTGSTWSGDINPSISGLTLPNAPFVTDIAINPNNSNQVIVSYGGYNTNNLFYTANGNSTNPTWTNINTTIPIQINSVVWHPSNTDWIYVGTDFGVLASEDKGQNWSITPLYSGAGHEGPINTEVSELFWQPGDNKLCAATHGRGIWRSNEIKDKIYVDKDKNCGIGFLCNGSFLNPYNTFADALVAAGHGSEIIFKSSGDHEEIPASAAAVIADKRITITLENNGSGTPLPVVIK